MNMWLEIAMTLSIVALVLFAIFKGGQDNPVGTGRLQKELRAMEKRLGRTADADKLAELEAEMDERFARIEEKLPHMATREDVARIQAALDHVCRQNDRTEAGVQRIEGYFLQRGIDR